MSILDPDAREIYLSALRPPDGYHLDRAIGTTYSLDLTTLLSVPLAFALFDRAESNDELLKDPVLLLEALRRYAQRTSIFCNAGQIAAPRGAHALFIALEPMVHEVRCPNQGGVFHPKVWVLRFTADDAPTKYRALVLTRNLTPDRSWDTVLALEGEVADRERAYARNHPLADFVAALPGLATAKLPKDAAAGIRIVERELRRVEFELPEPFEDLRFWPLGIDGYSRSPFEKSEHRRALVISPFVRADLLATIGGSGDDILIARPEEMDAIGAVKLKNFSRLFTLCEQVEHDDASEATEGQEPARSSPAGLHAKLYVLDHGWDSHVITGSANATIAAFKRNVEFCVELVGKKSKVGIDALLGEGATSGIASLLQPYTPPEKPVLLSDPELEAEKRLESLRAAFASSDLIARVSQSTGQTFAVELALKKGTLSIPRGVTATIRPVTLTATHARNIDELASSGRLTFSSVSLLGISAFYSVVAETLAGGETHRLEFVVTSTLENCPDGRENAVLRSVVGSRENLVRYLLLLLADELDDPALTLEILTGAKTGAKRRHGMELSMPVLEHLLRAYARSPEKLDAIHKLVSDLRADPESAKLLPEGFERVWDPIWRARERAKASA